MSAVIDIESEQPGEQYEALDYQLLTLFESIDHCLFDGDLQVLFRKKILALSKANREGVIALACNEEESQQLLMSRLVSDGSHNSSTPLILDHGYLYFHRYWQYQKTIESNILERVAHNSSNVVNDAVETWRKCQLQQLVGCQNDEQAQNSPPDWQTIAVALALRHRFFILSGGPGTGKTTTIARMLVMLVAEKLAFNAVSERSPIRCLLAAPTGKAAMRMRESIQAALQDLKTSALFDEDVFQYLTEDCVNAATLHRMLGYQHGKVTFRHHRKNPLSADIVIIDEASMIDIALMSKTLDAIPIDAHCILIGDQYQLSAVETGSVFSDLCPLSMNDFHKSNQAYLIQLFDEGGLTDIADKISHPLQDYSVQLKKNWRFDEDSPLEQFATAINTGDLNQVLNLLSTDDRSVDISPSLKRVQSQIMFEPLQQSFSLSQLIKPWQPYIDAVNTLRDKENIQYESLQYLISLFNQYRILCALRIGPMGNDAVSRYLDTALYASITHSISDKPLTDWYHGRTVLITKNLPDTGLYNGDIGIALENKSGELMVYFESAGESDDKMIRSFSPYRIQQFLPAWSMTIHKSQGSEFDCVRLLLPDGAHTILSRQLLYTGVTRAKRRVIINSTRAVLEKAVQTTALQATRLFSY